MSTISTSIAHGIALGSTYTSPLTITSTGAVEASSGNAIYGPATNAWTVANQGILSASTAGNFAGVYLTLGGYVGNSANGRIQGNVGVRINGAAGTVTNSATIVGGAYSGVGLYKGGSVANTGTGLIEGNTGVDIRGAIGTVTNSGTIVATGVASLGIGVDLEAGGSGGGSVGNTGLIEGTYGVYIFGAGRVTNTGTIIGTGRAGVALQAGGTVVDSGTIIGGNGIAVYFVGGGGRLVLDPGYHLGGKVVGNLLPYGPNILELGSAASVGTVTAVLATEFVNFGAVTVDTGARWVLSGSNTIGSGGTLSVAGTISGGGLVVESGGSEFVLSGGAASGTVLSGGTEIVSAGGRASATIVASGGREIVHGTASGDTVDSGGRQTVSSGGVASGATVKLGGSQSVLSGGTTRATVLSGGSEIVSAGALASGTTINSGGTETLHGTASGGTANSGGHQIVSAGGVANDVTVKHGGNQTVLSGGTTRRTVLNGGSEIISAGGTASATIVDSGGTETVHGKASGGTINGGLTEVVSGGTASGTISFVSGGTLQLDAGAGFTGNIKNFGQPDLLDRIDLRGVAFGAGTTESFLEAASHTSGTLTVTDGSHTVHLKLLGLYKTSNFKLATDGHGGTRVTDPPDAAGASRTTFADIAPAQLDFGGGAGRNLSNYSMGAIAADEPVHAGHMPLATGPPGAPGGDDHHLPLPAPR